MELLHTDAASVLRLNRAPDLTDSFVVGGERDLVPAASPLEMSRQELEDLATLRRSLTADFAELLLENFEVQLDLAFSAMGE